MNSRRLYYIYVLLLSFCWLYALPGFANNVSYKLDGVSGDEDQFWGVWVNNRTVSDLRRVTDTSDTPFGGVGVEDGDVITFKLMQMD